jgi:hypothetical protein
VGEVCLGLCFVSVGCLLMFKKRCTVNGSEQRARRALFVRDVSGQKECQMGSNEKA